MTKVKSSNKRPTIPQAIRYEIWRRDMGNCFEGKCPITWCHEKVSVANFVLAHNIPFSTGGATDMSNLRVTCASCNGRMGNRYTVDEWNKLGGLGAPATYASQAPTADAVSPATCGCWG